MSVFRHNQIQAEEVGLVEVAHIWAMIDLFFPSIQEDDRPSKHDNLDIHPSASISTSTNPKKMGSRGDIPSPTPLLQKNPSFDPFFPIPSLSQEQSRARGVEGIKRNPQEQQLRQDQPSQRRERDLSFGVPRKDGELGAKNSVGSSGGNDKKVPGDEVHTEEQDEDINSEENEEELTLLPGRLDQLKTLDRSNQNAWNSGLRFTAENLYDQQQNVDPNHQSEKRNRLLACLPTVDAVTDATQNLNDLRSRFSRRSSMDSMISPPVISRAASLSLSQTQQSRQSTRLPHTQTLGAQSTGKVSGPKAIHRHILDRNDQSKNLIKESILKIVAKKAMEGDVQTCAVVCLLTRDHVHYHGEWVTRWVYEYGELLRRHKLHNEATTLIKASSGPVASINTEALVSLACSRCGKSAQEPRSSKRERGYVCKHCRVPMTRCVICQQHVKGLYVWCQGCGHGGHFAHMLEWFREGNSGLCPSGCLHRCSPSTMSSIAL
mmetsp:Transcript_13383/g.26214  ORF Transcript_13383/g.26214 Transcript_13383/m.26214 type:complete len:490 (+) Transcript_13383:1-1470(+)